jgi:TolB-like protein
MHFVFPLLLLSIGPSKPTPAAPSPPVEVPTAPAPATPTTGADADVVKKPSVRIAVYRLDGGGIEPRIMDVLTDSVVKELRKLERTTVVGMDEIKAMLDMEAQKQIVGCSDVSCVAEIAEALGVDQVMIGNVAVVGETISFGLKLIDQRSATTVGQYANRIDSIDPADVLALIGAAVKELLPDVPLKPGMTRGVPPEIAARIHPPPLPPYVFGAVAATSGAAVLSGVGFTIWNLLAHSTATTALEDSKQGQPTNGAELNRDIAAVQTSFIGLVVSFGAAGLTGAGAAVVLLFTDWEPRGEQ